MTHCRELISVPAGVTEIKRDRAGQDYQNKIRHNFIVKHFFLVICQRG